MRKLLETLLIFLMVTASQVRVPGPGGTPSGGGGAPSYTSVQTCSGYNGGVSSQACVFGSNVTSGNEIYVVVGSSANMDTLTLSGCAPVTFSTDSAVAPGGTTAKHFYGKATSTAACTITVNSGGSNTLGIVAVEISGSATGTIDQHNLVASGFISSGSNVVGTAITTTVANDYILAGYVDSAYSSGTFTAGTGTILVQSHGFGIQGQLAASAGSVQPAVTSNDSASFGVGYVALEP